MILSLQQEQLPTVWIIKVDATISSGTIEVGQTTLKDPITVVIVDDTDNEGNQTFDMTFSNIRKAVFFGDPAPADLTQTITIVDNEDPILSLAETAIDVVEADTQVTITFNMTGTLTTPTSISYRTMVTANEAAEAADFTAVPSGNCNDPSQSIININND